MACVLATPAEGHLSAQDARQAALASLDAKQATYERVSQQIWEWAEVGYQEVKSSALLQEQLRAAGFTVAAGVAGMPTAFVASYGRGTPVIAILAEFDALPGITQDRVPERALIDQKPAGHACGHHLFGTGSTAAANAAGGTSIGVKGMMNAARTLTLTAIDLFTDPTLMAEASAEYKKRVGPDFVYQPLVGTRPPPLDYRK